MESFSGRKQGKKQQQFFGDWKQHQTKTAGSMSSIQPHKQRNKYISLTPTPESHAKFVSYLFLRWLFSPLPLLFYTDIVWKPLKPPTSCMQHSNAARTEGELYHTVVGPPVPTREQFVANRLRYENVFNAINNLRSESMCSWRVKCLSEW